MRDEWAMSYYRQADSDWKLFKEFQGREDIPRAQMLHYLQMATEKLAKAYRLRDTSTDLNSLLTSHVGFPKFFNAFLLSPKMKTQYQRKAAQLESIRRDCEKLASEVERLAPAVDRDSNPANCEYPWLDGGNLVITPVDYSFPNLSLLTQPRGRLFIKFLDSAFRDFVTADESGPRPVTPSAT